MSQIVERFEAAVKALVGDGSVKLRLASAYTEHLEDLEQLDLPISDRKALGELHRALHSVPPVGKEGPVRASVQKMSAREAGRHARTIVRIYAELLTADRRAEPLAVVESAVAEAPRYLVGGV